jgi:hypothetical protein
LNLKQFGVSWGHWTEIAFEKSCNAMLLSVASGVTLLYHHGRIAMGVLLWKRKERYTQVAPVSIIIAGHGPLYLRDTGMFRYGH